ncbi:MOSC domain-containing protein [Stutzerimonas chloritidismutans]|uniref:MOSC domain-containing protein n=1 Tax=Stutzerimonas chloritidismutans TaxID=203192 RepID=UPI003F5CD65E
MSQTTPDLSWPIDGPFRRDALLALPVTGKPSAMDKQRADETVWLDREGLHGDRVADRRFHGGPDRSLCHYPAEHYRHWQRIYPGLQRLAPGAFGENLATFGLSEEQVCIGDRYRLGDAVIELSQPRSPCANLDRRHAARGLARQLAHSGRTGWLYRTLEPGWVAPGATLQLIDRPWPDATVRRVWRIYLDESAAHDALDWLQALPALATEYRTRLRARLDAKRRHHDQGNLF